MSYVLVLIYIIGFLVTVRLLTNISSPFEEDVFVLLGATVWPVTWFVHLFLLVVILIGPATERFWKALKGKS